jgi:hypothetical protein
VRRRRRGRAVVATLAADWPAIAGITSQYPEDLLALHGGW